VGITAGLREVPGRNACDRRHTYCIIIIIINNSNKVSYYLHAAVVKADDRCTPLDLDRANGNELPTDQEYSNKFKRQLSQKALHGHHPYDLSQ